MVGAVCGALLGLLAAPLLRSAVRRYTEVPWLLAPVAAAVGGVLGWAAHWPGVLLLAWVAPFGVALGFVDAAVFRLPDALTLPLALGTALLLLLVEPREAVLLRCLSAALAFGGCFALLALIAPLGLGDAKLAVTLGLVLGWYGWRTLFAGVLYGFALAGCWGAALLLARRRGRGEALAFGPHLLLGALLAVLLA